MIATPKRLLRLYPPLWRLRYGDEFLALLETTAITRPIVWDVIRAAARERRETRAGRLVLSMVLGAVTFLAVRIASALVPVSRLYRLRMEWGMLGLLINPILVAMGLAYVRSFAWFRSRLISNLALQSALICALTVWWQLRDVAFTLRYDDVVSWWQVALMSWLPIEMFLMLGLGLDWRRRSQDPDDMAHGIEHPPFF